MGERDRMFTRPSEDAVHRARTSTGTPTTWRGWRSCSTRCRTSYSKSAPCSYDLGRQPRAAREFFVKYQDRILFGKDPSARRVPVLLARVRDQRRVLRLLPRLPRVLEALRHGSAGRVLKKLYYQNALRWTPGLPRLAGSPTDDGSRISSPAAPASSARISSRTAPARRPVRVADCSSTGRRENLPHLPAVELVEGDLADPDVRPPRRRRRRLRAPPGGDPVGAAVGQGSGQRRTAPTSTARCTSSSPRATPASSGSSSPAPRRSTATRRRCRSARTCRPARCRPTRSRSSSASSTCRCSRRSTGSRR